MICWSIGHVARLEQVALKKRKWFLGLSTMLNGPRGGKTSFME